MKMKMWLLIALLASITMMVACSDLSSSGGSATSSKSCSKVLAEVGGDKICMEDFQARLEKIPPFYRKRVATKKGKLDYLNRMVEDELYYQEALKRNLEQDKEVLDQLEQIRKSILSGKVKKELMDANVEVSDADVQKYYEANKDEFMSPETVTVRHILFRVKHKATPAEDAEKKKQAEDVLAKIKGGMSFEDAAKKFSEDKTSAKKGGLLAPVKKGIKSAEFEKEAFGFTKAGEISPVFKDRRGFNILQFVEKTEPDMKDFEKVKARIKRKLQQDGRKTQMETFSEDLRKKYPVKINEDLLVEEQAPAAAPANLPKIGEPKDGK